MKKYALLMCFFVICACSLSTNEEPYEPYAGGPGSETTNGIVAMLNGKPASFAGVAMRQVDFTVENFSLENAMVEPDAYANENGVIDLDFDSNKEFRLTIVHGGSAFTKVFSSKDIHGVDTVVLEPTGSVSGVIDIPEGSEFIWVGVLGMDIMVKTDAKGNFSLPQLPSTDSLNVYFIRNDERKIFETAEVKPSPYKTEIINKTVEKPKKESGAHFIAMVDGNPAVHGAAALRSVDYKVKTAEVQNVSIIAENYADENGKFGFDLPDSGMFRLTVTTSGYAYSKELTVAQIEKLDTIELLPYASMSGNVSLNFGADYAWVGVYGLDILVKTDENGKFILPGLPANDSLTLYFINKKFDNLYATEVSYLEPYSADFVSPMMVLEDFENVRDEWYYSVDSLGSKRTPTSVSEAIELDSTRNSKVFHGKYKLVDNDYAWVLVGTSLRKTSWNISTLDSIVFYAKGDGQIKVTIENWDVLLEEKGFSLKASSEWKKLNKTWTRFVFTPSNLCYTGNDMLDCSLSWNLAKGNARQIHFFSYGGSEFFLDDIKLYGVLF